MGSMMDDINKFAKIWDDAVNSGIFKDAPSGDNQNAQEAGSDFFGNYRADEYDVDQPLNEGDLNNWKMIAEAAQPAVEKAVLQNNKIVANSMGKSPNPIYPYGVGVDQEIQKWDIFVQKLEELDELKKNLYNLESNLNALLAESPEASSETEKGTKKSKKATSSKKTGEKTGNKKIDNLQKKLLDLSQKVADLSNLLTGIPGSTS